MKKIIIGFTTVIILWGCAQFVPPTGGKKDIIPPKLVSSIPKNQSINFKGKTIELELDEFVESTSLKQELLITPNIEGTYMVKDKGKGVKLSFEKDFLPNTTYTFNFRNGIKDVNERNPAKNLKIIFSTGDKIDSLRIEGQIKNLMTDEPTLDALVGLYELNDTLVYYKSKPKYFIKTDSSGKYTFENIKNAKYRMMAFTDKNNNLRFDDRAELVGFIKDTINLNQNKVGIDMKIYPYDHKKPKLKRNIQRSETYTLQFDKGIKEYQIKFINKGDSLAYKKESQNLVFFNYPFAKDTVGVKVVARDSVGNMLEVTSKVKFNEIENKKPIKKKFNIDISPKSGTEIDKPLIYTLNFEYPLLEIDEQKIHLMKDTVRSIKIDSIKINETRTELKIYAKGDSLKINSNLKIESGAFTNIHKDTNSVFKSMNAIFVSDEYGKIEGQIENKKGISKIIQLLNQETKKVMYEQSTKKNYSFKQVRPTEYIIRIIDDVNGNGKWDMGDIEKNEQAEKIMVISPPIKLKANFEITQNIKEE